MFPSGWYFWGSLAFAAMVCWLASVLDRRTVKWVLRELLLAVITGCFLILAWYIWVQVVTSTLAFNFYF